jgi:hypothetical protein
MLTQGNTLTPTEIDQKDCSTAHKTLGVTKTPNRSQTGEMARLTKKSNQHAAAIFSNSVTHSDSLTTYQVYHLTSICYSLSVTYYLPSKKQCHHIQGRAVSAFLATRGYNRHFPGHLRSLTSPTVGLQWYRFIYSKGSSAFVCCFGTCSTKPSLADR